MRPFDEVNSNDYQENVTHFNNYARIVQTYFDYHGCLPCDEDDAALTKAIKVIRLT